MNEIIKYYIFQINCKIVVNKLQNVLTYIICWQIKKCHVGILFAMLECVWESDVEISCKEVAYSCMWVALYIWYCIQYKMSVTTITTCLIALKVV